MRMMERSFNVIVEKSEDGLVAEVVELPGCYTQADTYDELLKNVKEAIGGYLLVSKPSESKFLSLQQIEVKV